MPGATATATPPANKFDTLVRQELAKASQRIRFNDLLSGLLTLGVVVLAYAATMITLDQFFNFPALVRQIGWVGFVVLLVGLAYRVLWLPLRQMINPRYAARQVEATLPDVQNALINWVDLQDENLPPSVKTAVAARAASGVADADINKATESRKILWLGAVLGLLFATLAALFILFKPNPFLSLMNRAFNPFFAGKIAAKTELLIKQPEGGDVTITNGEPLTISVFVSGSIPDPDSPNKLRVQVRSTPDSTEFDEFPLTLTGGSREWSVRLPASVIQTGIWYKVLGNDASTPLHQVTVRSRPIVKGFEATYVYPAYLRMKDETDRDPRLVAYKGTQVTLLVKANREVRRGWLQIEGKTDPIAAEVLREAPDTMRFRLMLMESSSYRVGFTSQEDEASEPTAPYPIKVLEDQAPVIVIDRPTEDTVPVPLNGKLELDATFSDDFGLGKISLRLRVTDVGEGYQLQDVKHRNGETLPAGEDGSLPRSYVVKESLKIQDIKLADGKPAKFSEGQVIDLWYEATDNCTVPKPNVGKSGYKRIRFTKAVTLEDNQAQIKKKEQKRATEEKEHQAKQDAELKKAKRPAEQLRPEDKKNDQPENPKQEKQEVGEPGQKQEGDPQKQEGKGNTNTKQPGGPEKGGTPETAPMPKKEEGKQPESTEGKQPEKKEPEGTEPMPPKVENKQEGKPEKTEGKKQEGTQEGKQQEGTEKGTGQKQEGTEKGAEGKPEKGGTGQKQQDRKLDQQAQQLQEKMEKQERDQFGQARPESGEKQPESAPMPKPGGNPMTEPKASNEPKTPENKPEPKGSNKPGPKPEGDPMQKEGPSQEKPMPGENQPGEPKQEPGMGKPGQPEKSELSRNTEKPPKGELSRETDKGGEKVEPPDEDVERLMRKGDDLNSEDQQKREQAEKEFDERFGKEKREDLQRKLKSKDQKQRDEAKKDIDELAKKKKDPPPMKNNDGNPMEKKGENSKTEPKNGEKGTGSEKEPKNGENKQGSKGQDTKQGNPEKGGTGQDSKQEKKLSPEEMKQLAEKAKDLASPDQAKREQAEKDFDKMMGKENREKLQQDMKDLQSGDQKRREDAQRRIENQAQEAMKKEQDKNPPKKPTEQELKDLAEKAKDLNSPDKDKQDAARKDLDQKIGKEAREQLEKDLKDLNSKDPKERKAAEDKLKQAAEELAKQAKDKPPSKEDLEKFAKEAEKLASKDPKERKAAEEKFDKQLGEEDRKQLQKDLEDLKSGDEKRQQEAMNRLQNALKDVQPGKMPKEMKQGGGGRTDQDGKPIEDDPKNKLKTAELQLKQFEKSKGDAARLKELGYTPEEYERFLKAYEERVKRLREEVAQQTTNPEKRAEGPATLKVGEGSGGKKLETRPDGTGSTNSAGAGTAPPGYTEAQKRFAEEAAKLRKSNEKK